MEQSLPGDALVVYFEGLPDKQTIPPFQEVVQRNGTITLLSNQVFAVVGKTRGELAKEILDFYVPRFFRVMTPRVMKTDPPYYRVFGEVNAPGLQIYMGRLTVLGAIESAGGFTASANRRKVQLIPSVGLGQEGPKRVINCVKAQKDPKLDVAVGRGDKILVPRSGSFWRW